MKNSKQGGQSVDKSSSNSSLVGERVIYVMPENMVVVDGSQSVGLSVLLASIWNNKWYIAAFVSVVVLLATVYATTATEWYRAELVMVPAEEDSASASLGGLGSLAGLAELAGVSVGGGRSAEPLAVLKSRRFIRQFVEELDLLPILFEGEWSSENNVWISTNSEDWPDLQDAVEFIQEEILAVEEQDGGEVVTLSIAWTDPETAAFWANELVDRLNERMRQQALREAEENVAFLREEIGANNLVALQQAAGQILEGELQKLMLARGKEEFSFRIIDPAEPPNESFRPMRALIVGFAFVFGVMVAFGFVAIRDMVYRMSSH
jgi:uncharacterized protein involved in exopolysaccharide biosynthesis